MSMEKRLRNLAAHSAFPTSKYSSVRHQIGPRGNLKFNSQQVFNMTAHRTVRNRHLGNNGPKLNLVQKEHYTTNWTWMCLKTTKAEFYASGIRNCQTEKHEQRKTKTETNIAVHGGDQRC